MGCKCIKAIKYGQRLKSYYNPSAIGKNGRYKSEKVIYCHWCGEVLAKEAANNEGR